MPPKAHRLSRHLYAGPWILLALVALPALAAERLVGRAHVLDGDTVVVAGIHVRLKGVAPRDHARP